MKHIKLLTIALVAAYAKYALVDGIVPGREQLFGLIIGALGLTLLVEAIWFLVRPRGDDPEQRTTVSIQHLLLVFCMLLIGCLTGWVGKILDLVAPYFHFDLVATLIGVVVGALWFLVQLFGFGKLLNYVDIDKELPFEIKSLASVSVTAGLAGFIEEVVFRGWLLIRTGTWISSLLFAYLHLGSELRVMPRTMRKALGVLLYVSKLTMSGLLLSFMVNHFHSLWPSVAAHTTVDFIGLFIIWRHGTPKVTVPIAPASETETIAPLAPEGAV